VNGETAEELFEAPACRDRLGNVHERLEARDRSIPGGSRGSAALMGREDVVHLFADSAERHAATGAVGWPSRAAP